MPVTSDPALVFRPREVNYSRPAVGESGTAARQAAGLANALALSAKREMRPDEAYSYRTNDHGNQYEGYSDDDYDDYESDDDHDKDHDAVSDDNYTLHAHIRSSFDSAYASSETGLRSNVPSNQERTERKHIVYLHRRPATTSTTLNASEQQYNSIAARESPIDPDAISPATVPRPRTAAASQPPRPISLASTYRPVSRLSTTSTASSDTITPASYRKNARLSAAALKPLDLTRTISSNISSASAPVGSPSSPTASQHPTSTLHSARGSLHTGTPSFPPTMRPSPRTPAVVMFTTDLGDEEQVETGQREDSGDAGQNDARGEREHDGERPWQVSDCDYSGLSEKHIQKLRKKGINPALYVEMQAARKKAGRIGILSGNTYLS